MFVRLKLKAVWREVDEDGCVGDVMVEGWWEVVDGIFEWFVFMVEDILMW